MSSDDHVQEALRLLSRAGEETDPAWATMLTAQAQVHVLLEIAGVLEDAFSVGRTQ